MYAEFFGLTRTPFSIAPDPRYLYLSRQHREALVHLEYGASESNGFVLLTGEIGSGKTTLVRRLLEQLPSRVEVAYLFNPDLTPEAMLCAILSEFGVEIAGTSTTREALASRLYRYLLSAHTRGRRVVVVIDEAQRLSAVALEEIRLLTNLETNQCKLLNVILVGQPELRDALMRPELRQLTQRITARYHLGPLTLDETRLYIGHRLRLAGAPGRIFSPAAIRLIQRRSHGIPRLINQICERAMMGAYARGRREVSVSLVHEAVRDLAGLPARGKAMGRPLLLLLALIAGGGAFAWWAGRGTGPERPVNISVAFPQWVVSASAAGPARELLRLWGVAPTPGDSPCRSAGLQGLACLHTEGDLALLRLLNRPAALMLVVGKHRVTVIVEHIGASHVRLALAPGIEREFSLAVLEKYWYGQMWLLWRPPGGTVLLRPGMRGAGVAWLRRSLGMPGHARDRFGTALEKAVRVFQQHVGLATDGIAGPRTLIALRSRLEPLAGPRLGG